ncbi:nucleotidyltransferase family protein [Spirosoma endbachense]|uniref:Nucleotidyltransferase domain-containing protein n=1 Tax=Spirosoma endbachense TaxID=2666025 RepID=A0A6P1VY81_9BACT|nr:nucleotidyltransferase domain-containing protein [Spirosoma endbachense]QHV97604.1 nucleotidyltransferase domain-containing protein [Spirosoma endbachense]
MIHAILADKLSIVTRILKENGVKRAYAFGSVCTEQFTETSDIDLLIDFDELLDPISYGENFFAIADALESILKRPVDLVTQRSVKNPYFSKILDQTKMAIYE